MLHHVSGTSSQLEVLLLYVEVLLAGPIEGHQLALWHLNVGVQVVNIPQRVQRAGVVEEPFFVDRANRPVLLDLVALFVVRKQLDADHNPLGNT